MPDSKMTFRSRLTIRRKLLLISMLTTMAALTLACLALLVYDQFTFKQKIVDDLSTLADILGDNSSAAITFNDRQAAADVLAALKAKPQVISAGIYLADGTPFVSYPISGLAHFDVINRGEMSNWGRKGESCEYQFTRDNLILCKPIHLAGETIGAVYLQQSLAEITERFKRNAATSGIILLLTGIVAYIISFFLGRMISRPILLLADTANQVALGKNYSVRAIQNSNDEVGLLTKRFNEMLSQIEERDRALMDAQVILKREVEEKNTEILERQRAERELDRAIRELERSNAELQQFAYIASHDLQEPLRMVSSYVQLLEKRYKNKLDKDADEFIAFAVDGAQRMQRLIQDLLSYSRVGTRGKAFEPTDCEEVFRLSILNLQKAIEESHAQVTRNELPTLLADRTQLVQLMQNLIGNAIKFRPPDGIPKIHVSAVRSNGDYIFAVKDNGIGIDSKYYERVFQIFQRLHTRGEYAGTGIGLAVCAKIVARHGGRIWIESEVGKGSTFYFTLPSKREKIHELSNELAASSNPAC